MIKYSVLMSVYKKDEPSFLRLAIGSMLEQTAKCDQFVIVEDGPLPKTLQKNIDDYCEKNKKIFTVVLLKENVGLGRALDEGLKHCKNDLVARMDADDISRPERCEKLLELFKKNPNLALAGTNVDEFVDDPKNVVSSRKVPTSDEEIKRFAKRRNPFNHPTVMFRKSEVIRCGGYGRLRRRQDYDLWSRMLNSGCLAMNIDESLLLFRADEKYQKRRKNWENCKGGIVAQKENYKRGYCSLSDLIYVIAGQLFIFITPVWILKPISNKILRKKVMPQEKQK